MALLHDERVVAYYLFAAERNRHPGWLFCQKKQKKGDLRHNLMRWRIFSSVYDNICCCLRVKAWPLLIVYLDGNSLLDPDHHPYLTESRDSGDTASGDESAGCGGLSNGHGIHHRLAICMDRASFTAVVMLHYMWKYIVYVRSLYRGKTP